MSKELRRQHIINLLRALRLLPLAERLSFLLAMARAWRVNKKVSQANPGVPLPTLWLLYDTVGTCDYQSYLESGILSEMFYQIFEKYLPQGKLRVCEWGCGLGRVLRHLPAIKRDLEIFGTDYNGRSVEWCGRNLTGCRVLK